MAVHVGGHGDHCQRMLARIVLEPLACSEKKQRGDAMVGSPSSIKIHRKVTKLFEPNCVSRAYVYANFSTENPSYAVDEKVVMWKGMIEEVFYGCIYPGVHKMLNTRSHGWCWAFGHGLHQIMGYLSSI